MVWRERGVVAECEKFQRYSGKSFVVADLGLFRGERCLGIMDSIGHAGGGCVQKITAGIIQK